MLVYLASSQIGKVDIYFSAVGMIDIPTAEEIRAMIEEIKKNHQQFRYVA